MCAIEQTFQRFLGISLSRLRPVSASSRLMTKVAAIARKRLSVKYGERTFREPDLEELLSAQIVRLVMRSDGVDIRECHTLIRNAVANRLQRARSD